MTRRFDATIARQGPNPYVDVPSRVSDALEDAAVAGRIRIVGKVRGVEFQGTLVPSGSGHRLFLNGGLRRAAGVEVGDRVRIALRAVPPDEVLLPDDVGEALRRGGALAAWEKLSPSHRRELIRWIGDARGPGARRERVADTVDHVLGKRVRAGRGKTDRPLWMCPKCGNEFVNRNQYHSCKRFSLKDSFAGQPARIRALFDRFRRMVEALGPVKVVPYREKVGFMVRVRFAGVVPRQKWLEIGFWLPVRHDHERFHRVETITPYAHVHLLRITDEEQLDAEVAAWLRESYAVGCQEHLPQDDRS